MPMIVKFTDGEVRTWVRKLHIHLNPNISEERSLLYRLERYAEHLMSMLDLFKITEAE